MPFIVNFFFFQSCLEECPTELTQCFSKWERCDEECNSNQEKYKEYAKNTKDEAIRQIQETKSLIETAIEQVEMVIYSLLGLEMDYPCRRELYDFETFDLDKK